MEPFDVPTYSVFEEDLESLPFEEVFMSSNQMFRKMVNTYIQV